MCAGFISRSRMALIRAVQLLLVISTALGGADAEFWTSAQSCGQNGLKCCAWDKCAAGLMCKWGTCKPCGTDGQLSCGGMIQIDQDVNDARMQMYCAFWCAPSWARCRAQGFRSRCVSSLQSSTFEALTSHWINYNHLDPKTNGNTA
jgi:hypothetical protein